jgi:hypothetical protein
VRSAHFVFCEKAAENALLIYEPASISQAEYFMRQVKCLFALLFEIFQCNIALHCFMEYGISVAETDTRQN